MVQGRRIGVVKYETIAVIVVGLLIIFRSGSPFSLAYESLSGYIEIGLSIILLGIHCTQKRKNKNQRAFLLMILFSIALFISMVFNGEINAWRSYLINVLLCMNAYLILSVLGVDKTKHYWIRWMRVLVPAALILYVLIAAGFSALPTVTTKKESYYTIYIASELITGRLSGFCWEPSMYAVFLAFSLLFELEENLPHKILYAILYIISLVLTQSVSAYLYLPLVLFVVYNNSIKNDRRRIFLLLTLGVICIVAFCNGEIILDYLYAKYPKVFYKLANKDRSFLTRMYNPICDALVFLDSPLFGVGAGEVEMLVRSKVLLFREGFINSRTSTCTYYFAAYGLLAGITMNWLWIVGCLKNRFMDLISKLALLLMCAYAFTSITLGSNQAFWIMLFYFYFLTKNREDNKGELQ